MPFVIVSFRGEEITRRELHEPLVIGRAPDCDVIVRDILLSRKHCRIAPAEHGWTVEDLGSKNGTWVGGEMLQLSSLKDDASIRIGKTLVKFYTGNLSTAPPVPKPDPSRRRPSDPFEALSGTVSDFQYVAEGAPRDTSKLPTPLPKPVDPASYSSEDVYTMLTEIASSSWDSIYATASEPAAVMVAGQKMRARPTVSVKNPETDLPPRRRQIVTDASLQVDHSEPSLTRMQFAPASPEQPAPIEKHWWEPLGKVLRRVKHIMTTPLFRRAG